MAIIETHEHYEFHSEDENGNFRFRITKKYPVQVQVSTLGDNHQSYEEHTSFNACSLDLEEIQELINRALIHFR